MLQGRDKNKVAAVGTSPAHELVRYVAFAVTYYFKRNIGKSHFAP